MFWPYQPVTKVGTARIAAQPVSFLTTMLSRASWSDRFV